jgi:DNA-binding response OmpR family regulator
MRLLLVEDDPMIVESIQDGLRGENDAIDVDIHHLRKKPGTAFIKNVRGVGYKPGAAE